MGGAEVSAWRLVGDASVSLFLVGPRKYVWDYG